MAYLNTRTKPPSIMKASKTIIASFLLMVPLLFSSCEDFSYPGARPGEYKPEEFKTLTVDLNGLDTLRIPASGIDTVFDVHSNTFWSIRGLAKVTDGETGEVSEQQVSWLTAPVTVFEGDDRINLIVRSNIGLSPRLADLIFYTADSTVFTKLPVRQEFDPSQIKPIELFFDFTDNSLLGWPSSNPGDGNLYTYTLDGEDYTFELNSVYISKYLIVNKAHCIGMPAIPNFRLTTVTVHLNPANTSARRIVIASSPSGTPASGGEEQNSAVDTVFQLNDTEPDTMYYLYNPSGGIPVTGLTLRYEP